LGLISSATSGSIELLAVSRPYRTKPMAHAENPAQAQHCLRSLVDPVLVSLPSARHSAGRAAWRDRLVFRIRRQHARQRLSCVAWHAPSRTLRKAIRTMAVPRSDMLRCCGRGLERTGLRTIMSDPWSRLRTHGSQIRRQAFLADYPQPMCPEPHPFLTGIRPAVSPVASNRGSRQIVV